MGQRTLTARLYIRTKWHSLDVGMWARVRDVTTLCHDHGQHTYLVRDVTWASLPITGELVQFAGHQWPTELREFDSHGIAHITLQDFPVCDPGQLDVIIQAATTEGWKIATAVSPSRQWLLKPQPPQ